MQEEIRSLESEILAAIEACVDQATLEQVRIKYLSQNGALPLLLARMSDLPKEERPSVGRAANEAKTKTKEAFDSRKQSLSTQEEAQSIDATLPHRSMPVGSLHPILQVRDEAIAIFRRLGFALADGPDIESEYYNFDALNTPPEHPARNEQDTFFLLQQHLPLAADAGREKRGQTLLRTQTSSVQIRTMETIKPPVRIVAPGRCYRRDEIDATHGISFHQMEGLVVDEGVSLAGLKGTLELFFRELLGSDLQFRFRPHFFPFTEPSFEVDCCRPGRTVKGRDWVEICGCGMVNPVVLQSVNIDPERFTGFAFGFGIERIAMQKFGLPDLRLFGQNDVRFLSQFRTL